MEKRSEFVEIAAGVLAAHQWLQGVQQRRIIWVEVHTDADVERIDGIRIAATQEALQYLKIHLEAVCEAHDITHSRQLGEAIAIWWRKCCAALRLDGTKHADPATKYRDTLLGCHANSC